MIISARVHYSCLALYELAIRRHESSPVTAHEISDRHGIPGPFLNQILRSLRRTGWVQSSRGSQGGYRLLVEPESITLLDIADELGCQESHDHGDSSATQANDVLQTTWASAAESARAVLAKTTLADLVEQCRASDASMYFI
ncbi:MAG: Rrf2 family transcriptional regulator [Planctomycetota bacterium]